jgi:hypothetical protein
MNQSNADLDFEHGWTDDAILIHFDCERYDYMIGTLFNLDIINLSTYYALSAMHENRIFDSIKRGTYGVS